MDLKPAPPAEKHETAATEIRYLLLKPAIDEESSILRLKIQWVYDAAELSESARDTTSDKPPKSSTAR